MLEKYQPTEEETKKAEETMTESQKDLSRRRHESSESLKELGVDGYLEYVSGVVSGIINGHNIYISKKDGYEVRYDEPDYMTNNDYADTVVGKIDGIEMNKDEITRFFRKYKKSMAFYGSDELKQDFSKEALLEDVGL